MKNKCNQNTFNYHYFTGLILINIVLQIFRTTHVEITKITKYNEVNYNLKRASTEQLS